jgi:hypothetical protein
VKAAAEPPPAALGLGASGDAVLLRDLRQVVEIVAEDVGQVGHAGLDVPRHRQVDEEERPARPAPHCLRRGLAGDDRSRRGGGADHHVEFRQAGLPLFERQGARAQGRGQLHRALAAAARDGQGAGAAALEGADGLLADLARSHDQDPGLVQLAENIQGQVHGDVGHADLSGGDGGVGAHVLRRLEGLLENAVEDRPCRAAGLGRGVGVLHLAEDFVLAQHLRVEPRRHLEEMLGRRRPGQAEADLLEFGRIAAAAGAEGGLDPGDRGRVGRDSVEFHPVAGGEGGELAQPAHLGQLRAQRGLRLRRERELFAEGEGGGMVGRAQDEEAGAVHAGWMAIRSGSGCRLALTRGSEIRANRKRMAQIQAKRVVKSRPRRRRVRVAA